MGVGRPGLFRRPEGVFCLQRWGGRTERAEPGPRWRRPAFLPGSSGQPPAAHRAEHSGRSCPGPFCRPLSTVHRPPSTAAGDPPPRSGFRTASPRTQRHEARPRDRGPQHTLAGRVPPFPRPRAQRVPWHRTPTYSKYSVAGVVRKVWSGPELELLVRASEQLGLFHVLLQWTHGSSTVKDEKK